VFEKNNPFGNSSLTLLRNWHGSCFAIRRGIVPGMQTATFQETFMNTRISSKLAALAIALMMNSFIIGGVAYLFDAQTQQHLSPISIAKRLAAFQWLI
jgi:hypothetical protein